MPTATPYLTEAADLVLDSTGNIRVASTPQETVTQAIACRLRAFRGEAFLDRGVGVPYFSEVLVKNPDVGRIRALLLAQVKSIPGVKSILSFAVKFVPAQRLFRVDFRVLADNGEIVAGGI